MKVCSASRVSHVCTIGLRPSQRMVLSPGGWSVQPSDDAYLWASYQPFDSSSQVGQQLCGTRLMAVSQTSTHISFQEVFGAHRPESVVKSSYCELVLLGSSAWQIADLLVDHNVSVA